MGFYNFLISADKVCSVIPGVGTITNIINFFIAYRFSDENYPSRDILCNSEREKYVRHVCVKVDEGDFILEAIPVAGSLIALLYDSSADSRQDRKINNVSYMAVNSTFANM